MQTQGYVAFQLSMHSFWLQLRDTPTSADVADLNQQVLAMVRGIEHDQLLKIHTMSRLLQAAAARAEEIRAAEVDFGQLPSQAANGLIREALDQYFQRPPGEAVESLPEPEELPPHLRARIREDTRQLVSTNLDGFVCLATTQVTASTTCGSKRASPFACHAAHHLRERASLSRAWTPALPFLTTTFLLMAATDCGNKNANWSVL